MSFDLVNAGRPQLPHYWSIAAIFTIEDTAYKGNLREGGEGEEGSRVEETEQVDVHQKVPMVSLCRKRDASHAMCHVTCVP